MRKIPNTIAEIGPGESLGIGLSAMLCGVNNYYSLDVVKHSNVEINLKIFDELVALFKSRSARPTKGWPDFDCYLNENLFPDHILTDDLLEKSLSEERVTAIRNALKNFECKNNKVTIKYMVPWSDSDIIENDSVDVVVSHSVLEHVKDIESTYHALYSWLKPKGIMSHQIDYKSHGLSREWNGYRTYSEILWKIVVGKRPYLINRQPHSVHIELIKKKGFKMICELTNHRTIGIERSDLSTYCGTFPKMTYPVLVLLFKQRKLARCNLFFNCCDEWCPRPSFSSISYQSSKNTDADMQLVITLPMLP